MSEQTESNENTLACTCGLWRYISIEDRGEWRGPDGQARNYDSYCDRCGYRISADGTPPETAQ